MAEFALPYEKDAMRGDPTPENALQLVRVLDGMVSHEKVQ